ncbi:hypothetical protein [Flavivirga spongiicola]|uniref:YqzM family protein n=1 Tax=Flavivirga spongiicola TaxID=421621 RepID=A0ABU7XUZ8_9FLAO|nr:hypothetical protein [Flavivirga sp. MEBiC05379]MDO5979408.1 hypothetical protein [Flavivirga sp. MEBiC05379]
MNFFRTKNDEKSDSANMFVEAATTGIALFFTGMILYGIYIIFSWLVGG